MVDGLIESGADIGLQCRVSSDSLGVFLRLRSLSNSALSSVASRPAPD
jgi:hypothetical protein